MTRTAPRFPLRLVSSALMALALAPNSPAADPLLSTDRLNKAIDAVAVSDLSGKPARLPSDGSHEALVVVFLSFECPVSNSYVDSLAAMSRAYAERGVSVVAVLPSDDPVAELAQRASEYKLPFPVYVDPKSVAVAAFKATATPEAFLLDGKNVLRYRGRIDDGYAARLRKNARVTERNLESALDELLAGKPVTVPATKAVGCPVPSRTTTTTAAAAVRATVSYYRDVVPVLQAHCQACHRPGGAGPFSLSSYKQAVNWASDIKDYTADRRMPPWKPNDGGPFRDGRRLSDEDIAILAAWVDAGCPEGNAADAPPPARFPEGWRFGEPDLVLTPEEAMHVGASGPDLFRCYPLKTGLTEDKYIVAYEVKPGNSQVVHHALNFFDTTGKARRLAEKEVARPREADERERGPGYSVGMGIGFLPAAADVKPGLPPIGSFGGWAPGQLGTHFPEGAGCWLPKEADVVLQVHYHRTGKAETDRPRIGLYFAKKPVAKQWQTITVGGMTPFSSIPAGREKYAVKGSVWLGSEADLHSVMPHMHLIGRSVRVSVTPPGEPARTLVGVKDWDYNWQETYWFEKPIRVPAGTRFDIEAVYDNSNKNPHNPNSPPKTVRFGEQTTSEMLFGFVGATPTGPGRIRVSRFGPPAAK